MSINPNVQVTVMTQFTSMTIVKQKMFLIMEKIKNGNEAQAVSDWKELSDALGTCLTVCGNDHKPIMEKCCVCLTRKLSQDQHLLEDEHQLDECFERLRLILLE